MKTVPRQSSKQITQSLLSVGISTESQGPNTGSSVTPGAISGVITGISKLRLVENAQFISSTTQRLNDHELKGEV